MTPADLEAHLHGNIPISAAMGVTVGECGPDRVVLLAALAPNVNHLDSAFGGSVASLATLAGWSLVHVRLHRAGLSASTVIQRSSIEYRAAATGSFQAMCESPDERHWARFQRAVQRFRRGRIHLHCGVRSMGVDVATFQGAFVSLAS